MQKQALVSAMQDQVLAEHSNALPRNLIDYERAEHTAEQISAIE